MGARGPAPKPSAIKKAEGTYRPDRAAGGNEPEPPEGVDLAQPSWLDVYAGLKWRELAPVLVKVGVLKLTDLDALAAYCVAWSTWRAAVENFEDELAAPAVPGSEADKLRNQRLTLFERAAREANKQMATWGDRLGLSPSQRTKVRASEGAPTSGNSGTAFFQ